MSVSVLLEVNIKAESMAEFTAYMKEIFPDTRSFKGCRGIELQINQDDPTNVVLLEEWDSRADHQKYVAWRTETGVMALIGAMLAGPPSIRYFDKADA